MAASNKFEELLTELAESGSIDQDAFDRIKEASSGSPLRKERDEAVRRAEDAEQKASTFRDGAIRAQLSKHELKLNATHLAIPDDLDVTDDKAFSGWLIEAGAIEDTEGQQIETELNEHEKVTSASQSSQTSKNTGHIKPEDAAEWSMDKVLRFKKDNPDAFEALKRGETVQAVGFS